MKTSSSDLTPKRTLTLLCVMFSLAISAFGQVKPEEILNPRLRAREERYLLQLESLHRSIVATKFSFPFVLTRYVNEKVGQHRAAETNAIEFVYFQDRVVLKISGVYKAAFNASAFSENERGSAAFEDVIVPILGLLRKEIPPEINCDGVGFEIVFDARDANKAYDYEGQEVLTVVFDRDDAFAFLDATGEPLRQALLNRSDIYMNGRSFGLAPGQHNPLDVRTLERAVPRSTREVPIRITADMPSVAAAPASESNPAPVTKLPSRLQSQYQSQLDEMVKQDAAQLHLEATAPPAFEQDGDHTAVHLTMVNPSSFKEEGTSIYKRTARSFDLFLAPELKTILRDLPSSPEYDTLHVTILDRTGAAGISSERIDYICPLGAVRSLIQNSITSQDLVDRSVILVNGVRIALNLQLVE